MIGSWSDGPFRAVAAGWVRDGGVDIVGTLDELRARLDRWDGRLPSPEAWQAALDGVRHEARVWVSEMMRRAAERERRGLERQVEAARLRLIRELGRYLLCLEPDAADLNDLLYRAMSRPGARAIRLQHCYQRLGGYPTWDPEALDELRRDVQSYGAARREARLLGSELDAALQDPRWQAAESLAAHASDSSAPVRPQPCDDGPAR